MELIGSQEDIEGGPAHQRVRAEGVAHLAHQRCRRQAVAGHVADHEDDVALGPDERVEPVAAHTDGGRGGQVARRHAQAGQEREDLREERPLERLDHDAGTVRGRTRSASATLSATSWRSSTSSRVKRRRVFVPTCITPTTSPCARSGTPRSERMPFWNRIGFRTVLWSTRFRATGFRSAAMRPANPLPHGDADAPFHLLLDPLRGTGHELVASLVQQEDGRRVGVEDLAHPVEQLVQEIVDREVGEGGVADALDPLETFQGVERGGSAIPHTPTVRPDASIQQCLNRPATFRPAMFRPATCQRRGKAAIVTRP